jgi:hypothetical protein
MGPLLRFWVPKTLTEKRTLWRPANLYLPSLPALLGERIPVSAELHRTHPES